MQKKYFTEKYHYRYCKSKAHSLIQKRIIHTFVDLLNYIMGVDNGFMMCYLPEFKTYLCNVHFSCDINIYRSNNEFFKLRS